MATSGYKDVAVAGSITLRFSWTAGTQNVENNYTPVNWTLKLISSNSTARISSTVAKNYSVTVDGKTWSGTNTIGLSGNATKTLASGSKNIYHNSDGTKTFSYSFSQEIAITYSGTAIGTKTGEGTGTLDTIPRGSVLGTIANFTLGNAITIPITKYSTSFYDVLTISLGGTVIKTVNGITNNASVSFTTAELTTIYSKLPSVTSGSFTFKLTTKTSSSGSNVGTSTKTATGTTSSTIKPTISSVSLVEGTSGLATQFGAFIQSKSTISGTVNATAGSGSSIDSYKVVINGSTYTSKTFTTGVLKTSGSNSYSVTVTDKRGRTASTSGTFSVTAYASPTITSFKVVRSDSSGNENNEGTYAKINLTASITSLSSKNTKTFKLEYKKRSATTWTAIETYTAAYTYTVTNKLVSGISADDPYDFRITATDYFSSPFKTFNLSTAYTILDILADGQGIAFGKVSTDSKVLDIGFDDLANINRIEESRENSNNPFPVNNIYLYYIGFSNNLLCFELEIKSEGGFQKVYFKNIENDKILYVGSLESSQDIAYIYMKNYYATNKRFEKVELVVNLKYASDERYMGMINGTYDDTNQPLTKKCIILKKQINHSDEKEVNALKERLMITDEEFEIMKQKQGWIMNTTNLTDYKVL